MEPQDNIQKYLPSKEFRTRAIAIVILLVIAIGVYNIAIYFKNRLGKNGTTSVVLEPDVIQKDSNGNEIPDWEESLWGLDPHKNGASNKDFILAKREALARENAEGINLDAPVSENETLAREFFAIIMSLQESGNLDETTMRSVGDTIGEKITATPIPDKYSKEMLSTIKNNPGNIEAYSEKLATLINKYANQDVGKELTFISVGLTSNDPQAFVEAEKVASAYKEFAQEALRIQVPTTFSVTHLALINNYDKVGSSIEGMSQMLVDPILGMKSIVNYKKYTDALVANINTLSNDLE